MKKYIIVIGILIFSCNDKTDSFNIKGSIIGDAPEIIYLNYGALKDSSLVINNKFSFSGTVNFPIEAEFGISPIYSIDKWFYIENVNMEIKLSVEKKDYKTIENFNFIEVVSVTGTKTSIIRKDFEDFERKNKTSKDWEEKLYQKLLDIASKNPQNRFSGNLIAEMSNIYNIKPLKSKVLYQLIDTLNQSNFVMKYINASLYSDSTAQVGRKMPHFKLPNKDGKIINTTKYENNILLIDFWASWCAPCRKNHPEIKKLYNKYNEFGLNIISVSVDLRKDKWLKAIDEDGLIWENVIDIKGFEGLVSRKYDLMSSLPHNYLVNKDGVIIAIDISVKEMEKILANLISIK